MGGKIKSWDVIFISGAIDYILLSSLNVEQLRQRQACRSWGEWRNAEDKTAGSWRGSRGKGSLDGSAWVYGLQWFTPWSAHFVNSDASLEIFAYTVKKKSKADYSSPPGQRLPNDLFLLYTPVDIYQLPQNMFDTLILNASDYHTHSTSTLRLSWTK